METKNQTAVEWLIEKLPLGIRMNLAENGIDLNQALAMERQQMIKFANDYLDDDADLTAEQYYNQIYGK